MAKKRKKRKVQNKLLIQKNKTNQVKKKKKERKENKKTFIIFLIVAFFFLIGLLIYENLEYKQIEYNPANNNTKIEEFISSFKALETYNNSEIINFIKIDDFKLDNVNKYLDYRSKYNLDYEVIVILVNNNIEYNKTISNIINHKSYKLENLIRYINYLNKYNLSIDDTIFAVNNNLDKEDIKLDNTVSNFMKQKYFISDNLRRYLNYYNKNKELSYKEVVTRVNSNLDKTFYKDVSPTDTSKGTLILVNKYYYLSKNYEPKSLVEISSKHGTGYLTKTAYNAFIEMYNDALKENLHLYIASPYRSYNRQNTLYTNYVAYDGVKEADTYSARPGYSEHQTGLAFDLGTTSNHHIDQFENSKEFTWVKKNAHKYGFILRYPSNKEYITGYIYEPWHYRYVGIAVATYIYENNLTFEEYYAYFVK